MNHDPKATLPALQSAICAGDPALVSLLMLLPCFMVDRLASLIDSQDPAPEFLHIYGAKLIRLHVSAAHQGDEAEHLSSRGHLRTFTQDLLAWGANLAREMSETPESPAKDFSDELAAFAPLQERGAALGYYT